MDEKQNTRFVFAVCVVRLKIASALYACVPRKYSKGWVITARDKKTNVDHHFTTDHVYYNVHTCLCNVHTFFLCVYIFQYESPARGTAAIFAGF